MKGSDLEILLKSDPKIDLYYRGLYSLDSNWPAPDSLPACYVINTDVTTGPGEHWISFYIDSDRSVDYWDSYGTAPLQPLYSKLRSLNFAPVRYNMELLQGPLSTMCWGYCLYFLHRRCRHESLSHIIRSFARHDFQRNDRTVCNFVTSVL
jgi:hypothetical protein